MPWSSAKTKLKYDREYAQRPEVKLRRRHVYAAWAEKNRDLLREKDALRRLEKRAACLVAGARTRARRKGLEFDLDAHVEKIQRRIDFGSCELSGEPFDLSPGRSFSSPSLDRIDPAIGYTYSNIRVVAHLVNVALGDWGEATLHRVMAQWLTETRSSRK